MIRHLYAKAVWAQEALKQKRLTIHAVEGVKNVADIGTKALGKETFSRDRSGIGIVNLVVGLPAEVGAVAKLGASMTLTQAKLVIQAVALLSQMPSATASNEMIVVGGVRDVCHHIENTAYEEVAYYSFVGMVLTTILWAAVLYCCCGRRPDKEENRNFTRSVITQSMVTYTAVRATLTVPNLNPRFKPLMDYEQGTFETVPSS